MKAILITALLTLSGCSTIDRVIGGASDLSSEATNKALHHNCNMMRLEDYNRIFNTVALKKAHAKICSKQIEVAEE